MVPANIRRQVGRQGFSLIEMVVVLALLIALGGGLFYFYLGGKGTGKPGDKRPVTPITKAKQTVCNEYLRQVRMAITAFRTGDTDEKLPQSLSEIRDIQPISKCPDGGEPYQYDPTNGQVHCIHPGHERF